MASDSSKSSLLNFSVNVSPMKPTISLSKFCSSKYRVGLNIHQSFNPSNLCTIQYTYVPYRYAREAPYKHCIIAISNETGDLNLATRRISLLLPKAKVEV